MAMWWVNKASIGVGGVLIAVIMSYNYYGVDRSDISYTQNYLRLYGSSIYEYHALTGNWPSKIDDLAITSLAVKYPHWWKSQLEIGAEVIVWPKDLKPDPKENARILLVYHNKGLDAELGRIWICWGDLRTGWITPEELQNKLKSKLEKVEKPVDAKWVWCLEKSE